MFISKTCCYAIRAAIYLAEFDGEKKFVPVREISEKVGVSFHFLTKILQMLTARNLMVSFRGPNGGIALSKPASNISLQDIIEAIDGAALFEACLLGLAKCDEDHPCHLHEAWVNERSRLKELFRSTSLQTIRDGASRGDFLTRNLPGFKPSEPDGTG